MKKIRDNIVKNAPKELLEDMFQDFYKNRYKIYKMNLIRGIFFGLGTIIGGTLVLAFIIWVLSFLNEVPFIGDFVEGIQRSIESARQK